MAHGDLSGPLDSDEFWTTDLLSNSFSHVSDTCYAVAFEDADHHGQIVSKFILPDGTISNAYEDILEFDTTGCIDPDILHISGDVFVIAYTGPTVDIATVSIDAAGTISNSVLDSWKFHAGNTNYHRIRHIYGNVYAVWYTDPANHGQIATFVIANDGTITKSVIATGQFIASQGILPEPIQVAPNIFLTHYRTTAFDARLVSHAIANDGTITNATLDALAVDIGYTNQGQIAHITGNIYALVRVGTDNDGFINTVSVGQDGSIGAAWIDEFEFNTATCGNPQILLIGQGIVLVTNASGGANYNLVAIHINAAGDITDPVLSTLNTAQGVFGANNILHITGSTYAITYSGLATDGYTTTFGCITPGTGPGGYLPMMGVG